MIAFELISCSPQQQQQQRWQETRATRGMKKRRLEENGLSICDASVLPEVGGEADVDNDGPAGINTLDKNSKDEKMGGEGGALLVESIRELLRHALLGKDHPGGGLDGDVARAHIEVG